ncbi:MAG TPA: cytochrome C [bacterium]
MLAKMLGTLVVVAAVAASAQAAPPAGGSGAKQGAAPAGKKSAADAAAQQLARGRYLVKIAGCNECHTAGYAAAAGAVPEESWVLGDTVGYRGAWGTTYPANLRLFVARLSEQEWIAAVKKLQTRPPMPWYGVRELWPGDLVAMYRYMRKLGPSGIAAPAFVPPGTEPKGPFVQYPAPARK